MSENAEYTNLRKNSFRTAIVFFNVWRLSCTAEQVGGSFLIDAGQRRLEVTPLYIIYSLIGKLEWILLHSTRCPEVKTNKRKATD